MKRSKLVYTTMILTSILAPLMSHGILANTVFPVLQGPWFGQKEPGAIPEIFAPDLISMKGRYEFGISFSPNLDELYFTVLETGKGKAPEIHYSKVENGYWSQPQKANFSNGKLYFELLPHVSFHHSRLYFSGRLNESKDSNGIWYATRQADGWSEPQKLDITHQKGRFSDINIGKNGEVLLTNMAERKLYNAKSKNGKFSVPEPLDIDFGLHGYISPEQDYLLVNAREHNDEKRRDNDLFVCFKKDDGTWSTPVRLGNQINSTHSETVARVSPDGKFLFFGRYNEPDSVSNIYWVSTDVIHDLKKTYFSN